MKKNVQPAIWLLVLIVALPLFSETVYTTSLPTVARVFGVGEDIAEYTLSIYLFGLGIGTLFWGYISDKTGRKPSLIVGIFIFIMGCIGCFFAKSIYALITYRLLQAFGGSAGSVLGQAIARDAFEGKERGKVFSLVGGALAISPAIGPILGSLIKMLWGWQYIFVLLGISGFGVGIFSLVKLKETHYPNALVKKPSVLKIFLRMIMDKKVVSCTLLVGIVNGIGFSYYAEGPFYLTQMLGMSRNLYGLSFVFISMCGMSGALFSKHLHKRFGTMDIIKKGIFFSSVGTTGFFIAVCIIVGGFGVRADLLIPLTLIAMMVTTFGRAMTIPNTLSLALSSYEHVTGTASAIFGFLFYSVTASVTYLMAVFRTESPYPMALYFMILTFVSILFYQGLKSNDADK